MIILKEKMVFMIGLFEFYQIKFHKFHKISKVIFILDECCDVNKMNDIGTNRISLL